MLAILGLERELELLRIRLLGEVAGKGKIVGVVVVAVGVVV